MSYWANRRICTANGGLPPAVKRKLYYDVIKIAAWIYLEQICSAGRHQEPHRLKKYKEQVCLFLANCYAPFDNNQAERDIRNIKVKTKVSGCFRNFDGAVEYLDIMSYIGTARKHGINSFKAVLLAVCGKTYSFWRETE